MKTHSDQITAAFTQPLLAWFDQHGRQDLPWQNPKTPYRVYLSEVMLQQTQVKTVIPYFQAFIEKFPDFHALATAPEDAVLAKWAGLGYYSRARNLHQTAKIVHEQFQGELPSDLETLKRFPGIGPSTAAAITSLAFHQPTAILDGNVKRVLARYFLVHEPINHPDTQKTLWQYANTCLSDTRAADYTQAIMDLGALCCRPSRPHCEDCPLRETCLAYQQQMTHDYPRVLKRKALPVKEENFVLYYQTSPQKTLQIYLEKRPAKGIWGGLWCLPTENAPLPPSASLFQIIKHTFTHFHLFLYTYTSNAQPSDPHQGQWVTQEALQHLGLPKPMQQITSAFFAQPPNTTPILPP